MLVFVTCTSSLPSCLWSLRISPSLPGSRLTIFLSRCKFSNLTTRQPMVEFYLLTFPRFPLRKKEHKSYLVKKRTHDFRTTRCAGYRLDHSGDERLVGHLYSSMNLNSSRAELLRLARVGWEAKPNLATKIILTAEINTRKSNDFLTEIPHTSERNAEINIREAMLFDS